MRGSVVEDVSRNRSLTEDKIIVNPPFSTRRELGELMNYNAKPLYRNFNCRYMNEPIYLPSYQRGDSNIWGNRVNDGYLQHNPFYRRREYWLQRTEQCRL
jgi:hypothetical protein